MVNTLYKHFETEPVLDITLHNSFPLAEDAEITYAYEKGEVNWDFLRDHFDALARKQGKERAIYINPGTPLEWREVVLTCDDVPENINRMKNNIIQLDGYKIDSFTIQAQRQGVYDRWKYLETCIYGFVKIENTIILGERGGSERAGQFVSVPAGAVAFNNRNLGDLVKSSAISEGIEEAGILPQEAYYQLIGVFRQEPPARGVSDDFTYVGRLCSSSQEILARHAEAMVIYRSLGGGQGDIEKEIKARKALEEKAAEDPKFPKDAWENSKLITIDNEPEVILRRVNLIHENGKQLIHGLYGALALYFLHEFGEQEFKKLMQIDKFKELVDVSRLEL